MWDNNNDPDAIIEERGLKQVTDSSEIESLVDTILEDNPNQLSQFRSGKEKLFGFLLVK